MVDQSLRGHHHAGDAEAALHRRLLDEGLLDRREIPLSALQALHRHDGLSVCPHREVDAAVNGLSVHKHGAGPALPDLASLLHGA